MTTLRFASLSRCFFTLAALLIGVAHPAVAQVKTFDDNKGLRFEIKDRLEHPFFWWPRTLLTYPVRFDGARVKAEQLTLLRVGSGESVPFQLSAAETEGGYLKFANVCFFADLPSGAERQFELTVKPGSSRGRSTEPGVSERREANFIVLDGGAVRVRIPASQEVRGEAPGPVQGVARGAASNPPWQGSSRIISPRHPVTRIVTNRAETGPLFITYQVTYHFQGGATYAATMRVEAGQDFFRFAEEMRGLDKDDGVQLEMAWSGFNPTHRQAPNHPYQPKPNAQPGFGRYNWERINQAQVGTQHGVSTGLEESGELPFRLGAYQPWGAYVTLTSANFWDERNNDAIGLFIDQAAAWQDHEYSIWYSSNTLQVRYFYKDGLLRWHWPLVTGGRSTAIAAYDHQKDIASMDEIEKVSRRQRDADGLTYQTTMAPRSYTMFLQNRFGTLDLNLVKDWVLEYGAERRRPPVIFKDGMVKSADDLERRVLGTSLTHSLPAHGTRQNAGFAPVPSRQVYHWMVDGYNRFYPQMNARQRQRLTAMYLLLAYVHDEEDYMPIRRMLAGHPNFLSDVKSVLAFAAFLFPEHPMAAEWADQFEKFVALNTRYHTRPAVPAWDARGGRWTENLGTYTWAFLRPALRAEFVLRQHFDGKNRFATTQVAELGDWIVNALSAPFAGEDLMFYANEQGQLPRHTWGMVSAAEGPARLHPPQGAHSARRMPPRAVWQLGTLLHNYRPLVAEHLMWAARPTNQESEMPRDEIDPWQVMFNAPDNTGTNPHLRSSKYTGYGVTLRANVDTAEELSVHLQQIDSGPNYRWGVAGEGGCGVIYYYASGQAYSHNGREDVGDRAAHDTDFASNFGVWKNGNFRSIGRNVLSRPLYDLGVGQFAEIIPRQGRAAYAWPEYQSRSVMLIGGDYLVTYDDVYNDSIAHRFAWFTHLNDPLPFIQLVKGGQRERQKLKTEVKTHETKGVYHDGMGDALAIISHQPGVQVQAAEHGAIVATANATDRIFRNDVEINYSGSDAAFQGTAGFIRTRTDGSRELAIFHGRSIAAGGVTLTVNNTDTGIGARFKTASELAGVYCAPAPTTLALDWQTPPGGASAFYLDGAKQEVKRAGNSLVVTLPAGKHTWQVTAGLPLPQTPTVLRTENFSGAATVFFTQANGATAYRAELSRDGGKSWTQAGTTTQLSQRLTGLTNGQKLHVRITAFNDQHSSPPADEYPVYVTEQRPPRPDGLGLQIATGEAPQLPVRLTWGEVLGVRAYKLYRRRQGEQHFTLVYQGLDREFTDRLAAVIPAFSNPGAAGNALLRATTPYRIYEYAVAAVNGNGESQPSVAISTDPARWLNWDPKPGEAFRRRVSTRDAPYDESQSSYYPNN